MRICPQSCVMSKWWYTCAQPARRAPKRPEPSLRPQAQMSLHVCSEHVPRRTKRLRPGSPAEPRPDRPVPACLPCPAQAGRTGLPARPQLVSPAVPPRQVVLRLRFGMRPAPGRQPELNLAGPPAGRPGHGNRPRQFAVQGADRCRPDQWPGVAAAGDPGGHAVCTDSGHPLPHQPLQPGLPLLLRGGQRARPAARLTHRPGRHRPGRAPRRRAQAQGHHRRLSWRGGAYRGLAGTGERRRVCNQGHRRPRSEAHAGPDHQRLLHGRTGPLDRAPFPPRVHLLRWPPRPAGRQPSPARGAAQLGSALAERAHSG